MNRFVKNLLAWFVASVFAYLLASLVATQSVVAQLVGMGIPISLGERLQMSGKDLVGMAQMFLPMIAVGFLVALSVAGLLSRWKPHWRVFFFALAGFLALITIHMAMKWAFDITLIAVARSPTGLLLQGLAGAAGGWLFTRLKPVPAKKHG